MSSVFEFLFKFRPETYGEGSLVFLTRLRPEAMLLVLLAVGGVAWWLYRQVRSRVSRRTRWVLLGLRVALLAMLLFMLARPALRTKGPPDAALFTAVLVDTSKSMTIEDAQSDGQTAPRFAVAKDLLAGAAGEAGLLERIAKHSKVILYRFDQGASRAGGLEGLKASGAATDVFDSVRQMSSELRGLTLAAVVMVSDGCRNEGGSLEDAAAMLRDRGVPLYAVGVGSPYPPKDYEVMRVFARKRIWRNVAIDADMVLRHTDFREPFDVRLSRGDNVILTQRIEPGTESDLKRVRLTFTPDHEQGAATYRVSIAPAADEKIIENNFKDFTVEIQDDRLPVLYVEGSPRMEYRFLRRALYRDRDFRLVGLLRLAADRFYIQSANTSEMYLAQGFPTTRENLFAFKAVILGDIEAKYFSPEQMALLEEFVQERGGGLLMLGGVNSFSLGRYAGTPVERMLPVSISASDGHYSDQEFQAEVTDDGLAHPVMRIEPDAVANAQQWEKAPALIGITPVRGVKAGASLLLRQKPADGARPILAVQNYGQGRVGAFMSGGSWYWQMSRPASDEFHEKFWKQMIRWLAVGARDRLAVETDRDSYARNASVILRATVLGKDLRPIHDARVTATIRGEEIPMYWTLTEEGVYQCRYKPREEGLYQVSVQVEGWTTPPAETFFEVTDPFIEFANAGLKEDSLRRMAETTGGQYFSLREASGIPEQIERAVQARQDTARRVVDRDLWDMPALLVLCLVTVSIEWIVRRRTGLA
ncbi:MAG TPA: hypothetical protein DCX07_09950 [Phycisphaerales bacterium]|nr:hypothetical protein [Phycisphaerales bacterium]